MGTESRAKASETIKRPCKETVYFGSKQNVIVLYEHDKNARNKNSLHDLYYFIL